MYADIIVDISHDKVDRTFQYRIPDTMSQLEIGMRVNIPFGNGNKKIAGFVVGFSEIPEIEEDRIKDIDSIIDEKVMLEGQMIQLASFLKRNYGGTLNQALKTVIPVKKSVKMKEKKSIRLLLNQEKAEKLCEEFARKHHVAKMRFLETLMEEEVVEYGLVTTKLNISAKTIQSFEEQGYIALETEEYYRNPVKVKAKELVRNELNSAQQYIVDCIKEDYHNDVRKTYLIKGVTGSGKTEVYMNVIEDVIQQGKQVIMLIPEIALTFQTVMRFYKRFGDTVSIMHSRLSEGERFDQYERARKGLINIMIGPRSALFTPFENLGLIVIDEEHEGAYKSEGIPKYHAVGVAEELCRMKQASLILGSATPSVDSYYRALSGEYQLFTLSERAASATMPEVHVVDLKEELKSGNRTMFSHKLRELIKDRLNKKEQTMLFINRRGYYGFISCRACGHVMKCPHCDISLTSHRNGKLTCHYCGYTRDGVQECPECGSKYIKAMRGGTQMVEEALLQEFPTARVLRMDLDTTSGKDGHEKILAAFSAEEADILVGTQMIVKGHDFPKVTLMGILAADISLHASDYRAAERTFELLTQAAGRAGRAETPGEVVIQAYDTEHFAIQSAAKQDYEDFYQEEILYRTLLNYPPVCNMLVAKFSSRYENRLINAVDTVKIKEDDVKVIGPSDASLYKAEDIYNKVIYYKAKEYDKLVRVKERLEEFVKDKEEFKYVSLQFDFNPY